MRAERREGIGGTGIDAGMARPAAGRYGGVVVKYLRDKEFAEVEHSACVGNYQLVVASCPSESGLYGPIAFEDGSRVAEGAVGLESAVVGQLVEALFHNVVIVLAVGIGSNLVLVFAYAMGWGVVDGKAYYGLDALD